MKDKILTIIRNAVGTDISVELFVPETDAFGHYSTNVAMRFAKVRGKKPLELAQEFATKIKEKAPEGFFEKVEAIAPGFINFWISPRALQDEFIAVRKEKNFGATEGGKGKKIIVEYSQPNIAKMMHVGHLRTTIIGDALANILEKSGYEVIRWNYLGDWGTQFGKLIAAYKMWGNKEAVEKDPIVELQKLYVRFHDEMKSDASLEKKGQEEFRKLEEGDKENKKLWEWFKKESLKEFTRSYEMLGVDFDVWIGESFYEKEMKPTVAELFDKNIAERSEGSIVVKLDAVGLPPALIEKSDGASLYLTRDIANLRYRLNKYHPAKILYVVGNEQSLHFEQLFAIAKILGLDSAELTHIKYGLVLGETGKKLATREGRTVLLKDVAEKIVHLAYETVDKKNPELSPKEKNEIAHAVGIGALKYNDLKENRTTDIIFNWEKMLDFSGDSGPYLQYTYARLRSILRKAKRNKLLKEEILKSMKGFLETDPELSLMRKIFEFPDVIGRAGELYATSILANYLYKLAVLANKFYETTPIMKDENTPRRDARLALIETAAAVLRSGLELLGMVALEKI